MEHTPNTVLASLVSHALVGCVALVYPLWYIRQLHTCIQVIIQEHRSPMNIVYSSMMNVSFPVQFRHTKSMPPGNVHSTAA